MKRLSPFFIALMILSTCAKKEKKLAVYKDLKYPITIEHVSKKMTVEPFFDEKEKNYWIDVDVDMFDEFPLEYRPDLYDIRIYEPENFKGFLRSSYEINYEETNINGTPAIASKDEKGRIRTYLLLIPHVYVDIWLSGIDTHSDNPDGITQAESDRVEQLTYEMIQHFKWEQKIDTTSEEFKAWKKHIWGILKSG